MKGFCMLFMDVFFFFCLFSLIVLELKKMGKNEKQSQVDSTNSSTNLVVYLNI